MRSAQRLLAEPRFSAVGGNVFGSISGVLVLAVLNTGLQFIQVEPSVQLAAKGALVILAVALNLFMLRRLSTL